MKKKLLFIVNPRAGLGRIHQSLFGIVDIFIRNGYEVILHTTQASMDACNTVQEYAANVDMVVCSGGDGTLDEVAKGVFHAGVNIPVGYIPAGRTNDFANSLFLPKDPLVIAQNIMKGNIYRCDIGQLNDKVFIYVAAFGLFTNVSYETPQDMKNILGHMAYVLEGAKRLFDFKSYHMRAEANGISIERDFIYGMVTNSRSIGGFKNLTKNVDMDDGLFEVTLIEMPTNPVELQQIVTALLLAEDNIEMIHSFKTRHLLLESDTPIPWTLDGEFGGEHTRVEIINHQNALPLLLTSEKHRQEENIPPVQSS